ncbi:Udp-glycosyltransferase 90a1 [Thalictrum thalictroides]|uniref:Glycosyltransferase n=1 Tax=Thalictrum thalictroides TaxID=46969 RepID=A0A7J6V4B4_THATH|nr:Udp-glycosyltransferase 90a1 [Thalictrum thalictroides]
MAITSSPQPYNNILIFPFMVQSHTLPLLDLSKVFSHKGFTVTIVTTLSNALTIPECIKSYPNIHIIEIPFPSSPDISIPNACKYESQLPNMSLFFPFFEATFQLQQPFEKILQEMSESGSLPICVISDYFFMWTISSCRKFNVPRFVFHGTGVLGMAITKSVYAHGSNISIGSQTDPIHIPDVELPFTLTLNDMPHLIIVNYPSDPWYQLMSEIGECEKESSGIIVNSFMELESEHVSSLESFYQDGCKAWCVGPLLLYDEMVKLNDYHKITPSEPYLKWLDDRDTHNSVIYVCFSSHCDVPDVQLDEIVYGLEMSGHPFIWAAKSKTWALPDGMEDSIKDRGWIVRDWVDQRSILAHPAIGGFVSHCGWNSVLESLCMGVPLLGWPMDAEQPLNVKFVVDVLEAGISIPLKHDEIVKVDRKVISDAVKELMESDKGKKVREKAEQVGKLARQAVQKGGSSDQNLDELVDYLCGVNKKKM